MSLHAQYHRLLREAESTADFMQDSAQFLRKNAEAHRADIDDLHLLGASLVGSNHSAIRGITAEAQGTLQKEIARARYRLGNLHG
ncbi:MAG TPA: hypothetical protein VKB76_06535, partial [Ktedonobacterales bacterium]|nr:hypothetical protein [Ktedonobacterales bacterium]